MGRQVESALRGFDGAPPAERAGFGMLGTLALTIGGSRLINYVRERRRPAPGLRSLVRRAYHAPGGEELRVHHFVPGMAISALAGATAILTRKDGREFWLSLPFGVGAGLTLDELALLVRADNPYWGQTTLPLAQAGAGALGAGILGAHFWRSGKA